MKRRPEPAELPECAELLSRFKHVETCIDNELESGTNPGHLMILLAKLAIEVAKADPDPAASFYMLKNIAGVLRDAADQFRS